MDKVASACKHIKVLQLYLSNVFAILLCSMGTKSSREREEEGKKEVKEKGIENIEIDEEEERRKRIRRRKERRRKEEKEVEEEWKVNNLRLVSL